MKKLYLFLIMILAHNIDISAQEYKKFVLGIDAAPSINWQKSGNSDITRNGVSPGFTYGLHLEIGLGENYTILTGVHHSLLGGKFTQVNTTIPSAISVKGHYQYVAIPIALKMKTNDISGIKYYGMLGLNSGINFKSVGDIHYTAPGINKEEENYDLSGYSNRIKLGAIIGGGIEYNISGNTSIIAGAHFENGFINTFRKEIMYGSAKPKTTSKGVVLDFGIIF